jgi:hypothetical protein
VASRTSAGTLGKRAQWRGRIGVEAERKSAVVGAASFPLLGAESLPLLSRDLTLSGAGRSGVFGGSSRGDIGDQGAISLLT